MDGGIPYVSCFPGGSGSTVVVTPASRKEGYNLAGGRPHSLIHHWRGAARLWKMGFKWKPQDWLGRYLPEGFQNTAGGPHGQEDVVVRRSLRALPCGGGTQWRKQSREKGRWL